ncbi:hypothetical protein [Roseobacter weihaiensis]|uniref:hypothetical protein n=1 Tax=Roseobacter weihaiensis TaxID=2763262 RepID=UPI001D09A198|nr:hypothetical protein [Roseobacter sp. H9]
MTNPSKTDADRGVRARVEEAADKATEMVRREAEAATDAVTGQAEREVSNAANAAAAASEEFPPGTPQARAADQLAGSLHQVADVLRDTDLNKAAGQVTRFARENPVLFLGGAALLGFAAARFLKATDPAATPRSTAPDDPWTGHVTAAEAAHGSGTGSYANGGTH